MNDLPQLVTQLARAVRDAGGRAMLNGGCVRDRLMGREAKDWDVEVYGVVPDKFREILDTLGPVNVVGEAFTVYKLGVRSSIFLCRGVNESPAGAPWLCCSRAIRYVVRGGLPRRDFTINAILQDPLTGEIVDPFEGRAKLTGEFLRMVSAETFAEDSLAF